MAIGLPSSYEGEINASRGLNRIRRGPGAIASVGESGIVEGRRTDALTNFSYGSSGISLSPADLSVRVR